MTNNEMKNKKDRTAEKKIVNKTIKEDNQAKVFLKSIRISPIKLNLVVSPIRGAKVEKAIKQFLQSFFHPKEFEQNKVLQHCRFLISIEKHHSFL